MTPLLLRFGEDPATGLPRLDGPDGGLSETDLSAVRRAIDHHFERLTNGPDGQLLALDDADGAALPRHFRVTVSQREKRCPTLLLEATEPPPAEAPAPDEEAAPLPPGRWQAEFVAEAAELVATAEENGASRAPLDFVLGDLRALLRKDPSKLTLLLFAGYLHVGDALSLRHGEPGDNRYARAARALLEGVGDALPEGALDPLLPGADAPPAETPPEKSVLWLRRFFSLS